MLTFEQTTTFFIHILLQAFADHKLGVAQVIQFVIYQFPNDKILDQTKLKAFADDKCNKNNTSNFFF